ncbi:MAG: hypothetical protein RMA76_31275 [Deltaproteobacteria bacterium]|jgi:hypothetical protein
MKRYLTALATFALLSPAFAAEEPEPETTPAEAPAAPPPPTVPADKGAAAFLDVARVLQSPRCQNCHPKGDRPLQKDEGIPHAMNISRRSLESGMQCSTCHMENNSEVMGIVGGPPGAPHWGLPPKDTPMIFEGLTPRALCEQLNDSTKTGGRDLAALLHHVAEDKLVLWGWNPGGGRTLPPLDHATFVKRFETWVGSGGACP